MLSFIAKATFAGLMVALVTVVARRHPGWGGLLAALPITSILALSLLWIETRDVGRVADLSSSVAVAILPSLPMFFVLPLLLRGGTGFWPAMMLCVAGTLALYALSFWIVSRMGLQL